MNAVISYACYMAAVAIVLLNSAWFVDTEK